VLARLADRVEQLERTKQTTEKILIVSWRAPGDAHRQIKTLRHGHQRWVRQGGESEDEFIDRAETEVERSGTGVTILFADIGAGERPVRGAEENDAAC